MIGCGERRDVGRDLWSVESLALTPGRYGQTAHLDQDSAEKIQSSFISDRGAAIAKPKYYQ
jgi:hypothetical protein